MVGELRGLRGGVGGEGLAGKDDGFDQGQRFESSLGS